MTHQSGRHFLQIPGPTNVPDRVLRAIDRKSRTIKNHGQKFTLRLIRELARRGDVTLMCHCAEDERHCHRHLLRALIASGRV